jgi:hypothetical protein
MAARPQTATRPQSASPMTPMTRPSGGPSSPSLRHGTSAISSITDMDKGELKEEISQRRIRAVQGVWEEQVAKIEKIEQRAAIRVDARLSEVELLRQQIHKQNDHLRSSRHLLSSTGIATVDTKEAQRLAMNATLSTPRTHASSAHARSQRASAHSAHARARTLAPRPRPLRARCAPAARTARSAHAARSAHTLARRAASLTRHPPAAARAQRIACGARRSCERAWLPMLSRSSRCSGRVTWRRRVGRRVKRWTRRRCRRRT